MADKAQRPPADYVEGEDYVWREEFQAYVSYDENGVLGYWDAGADDWVDYPSVGDIKDESSAMKRAREIAKAAESANAKPIPPYFWDEARDGKYPADWDASRYGEYPAVVDKEGFIVRADHVKAAAIKAAVAALGDEDQQGRIVEGDGVFAPKGTYWNVSPTGTISEWKPAGEEPQNTPLPEGASRVESEGGYDWAYDPATGDYTDFIGKTPEKTKRSTDQMILDYYEAGEFDEAFALDTFLDEIERPRGLTPAQVADLVMGLDVAPDEAREWIDALTSDWNAVRSTEERVESPGKALLPTAAERNAMLSQAAPAFGTGIPAGLGGAGAGGLQFPDWMTKPGGMPPTGAQFGLTPEQKAALGQQEAVLEEQGGGPSLTPDEIEARKGVFQGVSTTAPTTKAVFDPVAASLAQTYPDMDSAYRVGVEMQGRTGKEYRVVQKDGGYGIIEAPAPTTKAVYDPLDDEEAVVVPPADGDGPTEQRPTPGFTSEGVPISAFTPKGGSNVPFIPMSPELPEGGFLPPELLGDLEAQGAASGARVGRYGYSADQFANMPAPANNETEARKKAMGQPYQTVHGYTFAPTLGYKTKQQEIEESNLADLQRRQQTAPAFSTTAPQFQAGQTAAFKRGDIAQFERGLFDTPKPLSIQDTLQQMLYKKWQQKQQAAFKARPVQRSVFK